MADAFQRGRTQQGSAAPDVWCQMVGLEWPRDYGPLLKVGADLAELAQEVRSGIEALDGVESIHIPLRYFGQTEEVLKRWVSIANQNMQQFMSPMAETGVYSLEMCSDMLGRYRSEGVIPEAVREDLLTRLDELLEVVTVAEDLTDEMRMWLVSRLHDIRRALQMYFLNGTAGVEQATDEIVGGLARRPGFLSRLASSKSATGLAILLSLTSPVHRT